MTEQLIKDLLELSKKVEDYYSINSVSEITSSTNIELTADVEIPYVFTCEALHPGTYKGYDIEEREIILAKDTIFHKEENLDNSEINKDHKSSRKDTSSVDDVLGRVIKADYDYSKKCYILTGEIYDKPAAIKVANKIWKYVSLRINPGHVDYIRDRKIARNLKFEELSFVRRPGDPKARVL